MGGSIGNCLGSRKSWISFLGLDELDPLPFLKVVTRDLFHDESLRWTDLRYMVVPTCIDLLVQQAAPINLEKEEKDKFFDKMLYSSIIPRG